MEAVPNRKGITMDDCEDITMDYYVCEYETHKAIYGPWDQKQVVDYIYSQPNEEEFCTMSRYLLAKEGRYPETVEGNALLAADLQPCPHFSIETHTKALFGPTYYDPPEVIGYGQCDICGECMSLDDIPTNAKTHEYSGYF